MSQRAILFVKSMVDRFPSLRALLEEHVKDNLGEILPHVFFGEFTRYVLSLLHAGRTGHGLEQEHELRRLLNYLEEAYSTDDRELQELISVSFLENLPRPGEEGSQIRDMVGANLRGQLRVIG